MKLVSVFIFLSLFFTSNIQAVDKYAADRTELKTMLADIEKAINSHDVNLLMSKLRDDVVVTFLNAEVARGIEAVRAYFEKTLTSETALLSEYRTKAKEAAPAVFVNNVAFADGKAEDEFVFVNGSVMSVDTRWTTAIVKENDEWKVAQLHFSTNVFDNQLLSSAENSLTLFSILAVVVGLIIGVVIGRKTA